MDLGDKSSRCCVLNEAGQVVLERSVGSSKKAMTQVFGAIPHCRIAMEVGTDSPWPSRVLEAATVGNKFPPQVVLSADKLRLYRCSWPRERSPGEFFSNVY